MDVRVCKCIENIPIRKINVEENNFRILIIDDNPQIHEDFKKILSLDADLKKRDQIDSFENLLFGEESRKLVLPRFEIDSASQGQEGFDKVSKAIQEKNP